MRYFLLKSIAMAMAAKIFYIDGSKRREGGLLEYVNRSNK